MREATIPELELQLDAALTQRDDLEELIGEMRKTHRETLLQLNGKIQASAKALELQDECIKLAKLVDTLLGTKGMLEASRDKAEQERDALLDALRYYADEFPDGQYVLASNHDAKLAALEKDGTKCANCGGQKQHDKATMCNGCMFHGEG